MSLAVGSRAPGEFAFKAIRVPYLLSDGPIKVLPLVDVGLAKGKVGLKRQTACRNELEKAGVVLVGILVEAASKQVLAVVVNKFLLVRQVSVTGIEALGK